MQSIAPEWKKHDWWWRDPEHFLYDDETHYVQPLKGDYGQPLRQDDIFDWIKREEGFAWTYELVRRAYKKSDSWPPYIMLDWTDLFSLSDCLTKSDLEWVKLPSIQIWDVSNQPPKPGWLAAKGLQWNLNAPTSALLANFKKLIDDARKRECIPEPEIYAERRSRRLSWLWPELLDMPLEELSTSHKTARHKAVKRAARAEPFVVQARALAEAYRQRQAAEAPQSGSDTFQPRMMRRKSPRVTK